MREPWRALALAAALTVMAAAGVATAQTVVVVGAPRGSAAELLLNSAKIASATADATGNATLPVKPAKPGAQTGMDVRVRVDTCDTLRRVLLVEPGQDVTALGAGCTRREFAELFVLLPATTLVVDVRPEHEAVWVRQGRPPIEWLRPDLQGTLPPGERRPSATGFILSGAGSMVTYANAVSVTCGTAETCSGKSTRMAASGSVSYWFNQYLGAEVGYLRSQAVPASGSGTTFEFNSALDAHIFTLAGKAGYAYGPFRFYGQGGGTYTRTLSTTAEAFTNISYTGDAGTLTIAGGTQTFQLRTGGFGWMFGGGGEFWLNRRFALFGEILRFTLKGENLDAGEGNLDERLTVYLVGLRFHLAR